MAVSAPKRSPLTAATITPPHLNRQPSANAIPETGKSRTDATTVLANVASKTSSRRKSESPSGSLDERRPSWEECTQKRDGYVSFPDFDQLRAQQEQPA